MDSDGEKISCPFCRRELDDSNEPTIHCKFCGKQFRRLDVFNEDEKVMRQNMIIDLSTYMSKIKITKNVGFIIGVLGILSIVVLLFAEQIVFTVLILLIAFLLTVAGWAIVWIINERKYAKNQSKLFDLSGGRRVE